jgi:hypothetical protein
MSCFCPRCQKVVDTTVKLVVSAMHAVRAFAVCALCGLVLSAGHPHLPDQVIPATPPSAAAVYTSGSTSSTQLNFR